MDNRKKLIVQRITQALKDEGINKTQFAKRMKLHKGSVAQWFKEDHDFNLKTLFKIEKALDITLIQIPEKDVQDYTASVSTGLQPDSL